MENGASAAVETPRPASTASWIVLDEGATAALHGNGAVAVVSGAVGDGEEEGGVLDDSFSDGKSVLIAADEEEDCYEQQVSGLFWENEIRRTPDALRVALRLGLETHHDSLVQAERLLGALQDRRSSVRSSPLSEMDLNRTLSPRMRAMSGRDTSFSSARCSPAMVGDLSHFSIALGGAALGDFHQSFYNQDASEVLSDCLSPRSFASLSELDASSTEDSQNLQFVKGDKSDKIERRRQRREMKAKVRATSEFTFSNSFLLFEENLKAIWRRLREPCLLFFSHFICIAIGIGIGRSARVVAFQ